MRGNSLAVTGWTTATVAAAQLAAAELHDIAPPVDYSLIPPWVVFVGSVLVLLALGLAAYHVRNFFRKRKPPQSPRQRALSGLGAAEPELEIIPPYQFSIRVSDILRRYVLEQYELPMTRQTSVEFLGAISQSAKFGEEDRALLADFLNRCDLIKFARYEATAVDSRLLLDEARRFVQGGQLVLA